MRSRRQPFLFGLAMMAIVVVVLLLAVRRPPSDQSDSPGQEYRRQFRTHLEQRTSPTARARRAWWEHARFGLMIHWGPYAQRGLEASTALRDGELSAPEYEALAASFDPDGFDAHAIAELARRAGARYVIFTAKHHDGFAMYDSRVSDYDIMSTPIARDLMRELADAVRAAGLRVGFYFSLPDWHHPAYREKPADVHNQRVAADAVGESVDDPFVAFYEAQVGEILERYGPVDVLWFDVGDWAVFRAWPTDHLAAMVRERAPACLINDRYKLDAAGDFTVFEGSIPDPEQTHILPGWETCVSIHEQWAYKPDPQQWKSSRTLIRLLCEAAAKGGNFLLNIGLDEHGRVDPRAESRLLEIGAWLARNGESIYGTTAGPRLLSDAQWATRKDEYTVYLHLFDERDVVRFANPIDAILDAIVLATGRHVTRRQISPTLLEFAIPSDSVDPAVTVVELLLNSPPSD